MLQTEVILLIVHFYKQKLGKPQLDNARFLFDLFWLSLAEESFYCWCLLPFHCENHFYIIFNLTFLNVQFTVFVFNVSLDAFDGSHDYKRNMLDSGKKCHKFITGNLMMNTFLFFVFVFVFLFVFIILFCFVFFVYFFFYFQLSSEHFSVLPSYFIKREDSLEKRSILKLT